MGTSGSAQLSWGHLGHIIRYAFEWTGTECHGILRYGKIYEYSLFVVCLLYYTVLQYSSATVLDRSGDQARVLIKSLLIELLMDPFSSYSKATDWE